MTTLTFNNKEERDQKVNELRNQGIEVFGIGHSPFTNTYSLSFLEEKEK